MPVNQYNHVMHQIAELRRQASMGTRHGYVHDVQESGGERKARVVLGIKKDGTPWLSPWMHTEEHRGGSRSQAHVEKGQNMVLTTHGGDFRNATISPSAEGKSFPQPSHAPQINGDTHQIGKLRVSYNKPSSSGGSGSGSGSGGSGGSGSQGGSDHFYDLWIADQDDQQQQHQEQSGQTEMGGGGGFNSGAGFSGSQQTSQQGGSQQQQAKPQMKIRMSESGYCSMRVGNDDNATRVQITDKGAKIRRGQNAIHVDDEGCWTTKQIQVKPDTAIKNDNS